MSWVSENKFLTGFGVVMLGGLGTLGYFTWSAMDKYDAATGKFDAAVNELKRVEGTKPYPNTAHLKELDTQKQEVAGKLDALQKDLKSRVLGIEPMTKEVFQDRLKEAVARVTAKAAAARVTLPDKFYLDYKYQSSPPSDAAAPVLGRQLRAIELIMDILTTAGGIELKDLKREELPEERGTKRVRGTDSGGKKKTGRESGAESSGQHLVEKSSVVIRFASKDSALRQVLNSLADNKQQFFIVRRIDVQNEHIESPPKVAAAAILAPPANQDLAKPPETPAAPGAAPAVAPPVTPAPEPAPAPVPGTHQGALVYAFGKEKVEATVEIEILDFAEPDARPEKGGKGKTK